MSTNIPAVVSISLEALRARVAEIRERARKHFQQGASGLQTATTLSDGFRVFVVEQWQSGREPDCHL